MHPCSTPSCSLHDCPKFACDSPCLRLPRADRGYGSCRLFQPRAAPGVNPLYPRNAYATFGRVDCGVSIRTFAHSMNANIFGSIRPLSEGARVALVAPAGLIKDPAHVQRAIDNTKSMGWVPVCGEHVSAVHGYFAGTDHERVCDLNGALRDDSVDAIWCVRGGYGAMRLLDGMDYDALRKNPRPLIGFSDITALHAAVHRECGIVSFHGPTARGELTDFSRESLVRAVVEQSDSCGVADGGRVLRKGRARGRLAGGNLALVSSLMGTPYSVDFDGAILILEDIDEAVYRVDRMLRQLVLSGALSRCVA